MSDTIRQKSTELLQHALGENERLAREIEQAIFDLNPQTDDAAYKNAIRSHVFNLKDPSNPSLKEKVLAGTIDPLWFAEMVCAGRAGAND
jgi:hypothetical protein